MTATSMSDNHDVEKDQPLGNAGPKAELPRPAYNPRAESAVKDHMLASLGIGLIPIPLLDLALFMGSGVLMVKRICNIYGVPFKGNYARGTLSAIASSLGSAGLAAGLGISMSKLIPGVGTAAGMITMPVANAAFTYAAGKVFIAHFESGGTLLDFDPKSHADHIKELYEKGKGLAVSLKKKNEGDAKGKSEGIEAAIPAS